MFSFFLPFFFLFFFPLPLWLSLVSNKDNCKVCTPAHITGEERCGAHISQRDFAGVICSRNALQKFSSLQNLAGWIRAVNVLLQQMVLSDKIDDPFLVTVKSVLLPQSWQWYRHGISHHLFVSWYLFICLFSFPLCEWHVNISSHVKICYVNVYFVAVGDIHKLQIWKKNGFRFSNVGILGFQLLAKQNKEFENVTSSWKLWWLIATFLFTTRAAEFTSDSVSIRHCIHF